MERNVVTPAAVYNAEQFESNRSREHRESDFVLEPPLFWRILKLRAMFSKVRLPLLLRLRSRSANDLHYSTLTSGCIFVQACEFSPPVALVPTTSLVWSRLGFEHLDGVGGA